MPTKDFRGIPCALDNGAFTCWEKGYPFQGDLFLRTIAKAYACGIELDFIVCPDIVAGGTRSLRYSLDWAIGSLQTAPRLALAVQDGMGFQAVTDAIMGRNFTHIFVGGTIQWKWEKAEGWISLARANGLKCHIGRCGNLDLLLRAQNLGADSVDSTNFSRHGSWGVIKEFLAIRDGRQQFIGEGA
jgi:hypothetical protein